MSKEIAKQAIEQVCKELAEFLAGKNDSYGNSAYDPIRCFSKCDPTEQINVRMDDKLSRMMRGDSYGEDVEKDLIGYLILKRAYPTYLNLIQEHEKPVTPQLFTAAQLSEGDLYRSDRECRTVEAGAANGERVGSGDPVQQLCDTGRDSEDKRSVPV